MPDKVPPSNSDLAKELFDWWKAIAMIRKEEAPIFYDMSKFAREWCAKNGFPHAP